MKLLSNVSSHRDQDRILSEISEKFGELYYLRYRADRSKTFSTRVFLFDLNGGRLVRVRIAASNL